MFKIIVICIYLIQCVVAECPDTKLNCYNSKDGIIGNITVGQCWKWSMLACVPCSAVITVTNHINIDLIKYIHFCRYYYTNTEKVLKKLYIRDLLKNLAFGKR